VRHITDVGDLMSKFFYFSLDVGGGYGKVHIAEHDPIGAIFFWFVCMEGRVPI
jgi:hypothetical protein